MVSMAITREAYYSHDSTVWKRFFALLLLVLLVSPPSDALLLDQDDSNSTSSTIEGLLGRSVTGKPTIVTADNRFLEFPLDMLEKFLNCLCDRKSSECSLAFSNRIQASKMHFFVTGVEFLSKSDLPDEDFSLSRSYKCKYLFIGAARGRAECSVGKTNKAHLPPSVPRVHDVCDFKCVSMDWLPMISHGDSIQVRYDDFGDGPDSSTNEFCVKPRQQTGNEGSDPGNPDHEEKNGQPDGGGADVDTTTDDGGDDGQDAGGDGGVEDGSGVVDKTDDADGGNVRDVTDEGTSDKKEDQHVNNSTSDGGDDDIHKGASSVGDGGVYKYTTSSDRDVSVGVDIDDGERGDEGRQSVGDVISEGAEEEIDGDVEPQADSTSDKNENKASNVARDGSSGAKKKDEDSASDQGNKKTTKTVRESSPFNIEEQTEFLFLSIALGISVFLNILIGAALLYTRFCRLKAEEKDSSLGVNGGIEIGVENITYQEEGNVEGDGDVENSPNGGADRMRFGEPLAFSNRNFSCQQGGGASSAAAATSGNDGVRYVVPGWRSSKTNSADRSPFPKKTAASNFRDYLSSRGLAGPHSKPTQEKFSGVVYGNVNPSDTEPCEQVRILSSEEPLYSVAHDNGSRDLKTELPERSKCRARLNTPPAGDPDPSEQYSIPRAANQKVSPQAVTNEYVGGDGEELWHSDGSPRSTSDDAEAIPTFDDEEPRRKGRGSEGEITFIESRPVASTANVTFTDGLYAVPIADTEKAEQVYSEI